MTTATHARRAFAAMGITPTSMKWDTKCGCTCPCSPGFVVRLTTEDEAKLRQASGIEHNGVNVFVTVATDAR